MTDPSDDPAVAHPLEAFEASGRLPAIRAVCGGLLVLLPVFAGLIAGVVWFALDGQPIAGNAVRVGGVSALTLAAVGLAAVAVPVGLTAAAGLTAAGLRQVAAEPPSAADPAKLVDVFAAATFAEYAAAMAGGAACALCYHLTADGLLLAAVGGLVAVLAVRFPTAGRVRRWYDAAADQVNDARQTMPPG